VVSTEVCGTSSSGSNPDSGLFSFKVYIFDLLNTIGYKKNKIIYLSKSAKRLLQELGKKKVTLILFTSAKKNEVEKGVENLFDKLFFSIDKKNPKNLESIVKELEKMGCERGEICYVGDNFYEDFIPAVKCGINVLLLRRMI